MPIAAFPALSRSINTDVETSYDDSTTVRDKMTDGLVQSYPQGSKIRRTWKITAKLLNAADYAAIDTFVRTTVRGGADMFTFAIPLPNETVTVRFAPNGLPVMPEQGFVSKTMRWTLTAALEEV